MQQSQGIAKTGPYRANFLLESVADLRQRLRDRGSDLIVRMGKPEEVNMAPVLVTCMGKPEEVKMVPALFTCMGKFEEVNMVFSLFACRANLKRSTWCPPCLPARANLKRYIWSPPYSLCNGMGTNCNLSLKLGLMTVAAVTSSFASAKPKEVYIGFVLLATQRSR